MLLFDLGLFNELVVFDRVVDRRGGENSVELAPAGRGVVFGEDRIDDGALGKRFTGLGGIFAIGLIVIDVEAQNVAVLDGVSDGVFVQ